MLQYYGLNTIFFRIPHTMKFRTALSKAWTMQVETHTVEFFCFGGDLGGIWSVFIPKGGQNMLMQSSWEGKNGTFLDTVCLKTSLSAVFWSITMNLNLSNGQLHLTGSCYKGVFSNSLLALAFSIAWNICHICTLNFYLQRIKQIENE